MHLMKNNYGAPMQDESANDLVCFCFGYSASDIREDLEKNGRSLIMERIAAEKKANNCDCAAKNPKGR